MKSFLKKQSNKNKVLLYTLIISFIIFSITPLSGDDWGNYLTGQRGMNAIINTAVSMYKTWEGRFISRIFISFLTYHKWIWNLLNAILTTLLVSTMYKYQKKENIQSLLTIILGLLLVNIPFSSQVYLWLAGNITYFFPSVIVLSTITYILKFKDMKEKIWISILTSIISFFIPMFVENIGCAYVFGLFIILIYNYSKHKKISISLLIMLVLSASGLLIMLLSPGSQLRMTENIEFMNMNIFEKIFRNIPNFIRYSFTKNIFILILMLIPTNKYLLDKLKNKKYKISIIILFNLIPCLSILQNWKHMIPIGINIKYSGIFLTSNWYYIFYWILFIIIYFLSIIKYVNDKNKEHLIILFLIGISSMGVMFFTPVWGERVSALYIFIIILSSTRIISEFNNSNKIIKILPIILIFILCINLGYSIANKIFDTRRESYIKEQLENNENTIYIYYSGISSLWNYTPFEEYHVNTFKKYYKIEETIKLEVKYLSKIEYIKYLLKGKI